MTTNGTVVYILSLPRSGSTLAGSVLGAHSRAVHIGEVVAPLRKGNPFECRSCGESCPIWGSTLAQAAARRVYGEFARRRPTRKRRQPAGTSLAGTLYDRIFDAVPDCRVVCDSSKNVAWAQYNARHASLRHCYLFLYRDPRACWAGAKRTDPGGYREVLPRLRKKLDKLQQFSRDLAAEDSNVLSYEDFVRHPALHVRRLCGWLDLPYESSMLDFQQFPPHLIGGNPSIVLQHKKHRQQACGEWTSQLPAPVSAYFVPPGGGFLLDERWKDELTEADLDLFDEHFSDLGLQALKPPLPGRRQSCG